MFRRLIDIIFNSHDDSKGGGIQTYNNLTPEMLNEQLIKYEELVNIYKKTVPKSQQYGITLWGFNDRDTWINRFFKIKDFRIFICTSCSKMFISFSYITIT